MRQPETPTVSVQLITSDKAYIAVDDFVRSKIRELDGLDRVFATYEDVDVEDGNDGDDGDGLNKQKIVTFYPRKFLLLFTLLFFFKKKVVK